MTLPAATDTVQSMTPTDAPKDGQRLDTDDGTRWLIMLFGLVPIGVGIGFSFAETKHDAARWFLLLFIAGGLFLVWLGARYRRAYYTSEGLLRKGWTGREVVPWSRVASIEFDEVEGQGGGTGWVRLRLEPRRTVRVRMAPGRVTSRGRWIARACPQAAIDDRRTGEITPPREGAPEQIARDEATTRSRAARAHLVMALIWILGATACVALIVVAAAVGFRDHPGKAILTIIASVLAIYVTVGHIRFRLAMWRETRDPQSIPQ